MKRFLLIFALMLGFITEAGAVLKEKDLEQTLAILQSELEQYNNELTMRSAVRRERAKQLITNLLLTMKQADQNALMLYSQEQTHPFDMGVPQPTDPLYGVPGQEHQGAGTL